MKFPDSLLDEIRARLPVSEVVGRRVKLQKAGLEYKGLSPFKDERTPSFTVNDQKGFYHDFATGKHGDIFTFLQETEGLSFPQAVLACASQAGVQLPGGSPAAGANNRTRAPDSDQVGNQSTGIGRPEGGDGGGASTGVQGGRKPKRQIVAVYDYTDAKGALIYQVVRYEPKGFAQRRPAPDNPQEWVWGLDSGEYMRYRDGWIRYDEKRFQEWRLTERKHIGGGVEHGLYDMPGLVAALEAGEPIWIVEGEKDAITLKKWDLTATTNSGGARHWTEKVAVNFVGADCIIPIDNDEAGRERGHKIAASLKGIAKRVRVLDFSRHWTGMPEKADVTDWKAAGGSLEKLIEIAAATPDWKPEPPKSSFGAVRFVDLDLPAREHEWLIKGILPRGGVGMVIGKWQSGKSFFATDLSLNVALGEPYLGRKTRQGLTIYQAGEAGLGLKMRLRAAREARGIAKDANVPFVLMPEPLDMYGSEDPVTKFIAEAKMWSSFYEMPIELTTIDTFSAATAGANENSSEHVSLILGRGNRIARELGCLCLWVHHLNAAGDKARGHSSLMGNVDVVIEISELERTETEEIAGQQITRTVREARVIKQKEGERGFHWNFLLKKVDVGKDEDGDPVTSCIVTPPGEIEGDSPSMPAAQRNVGIALNAERVVLFKALLKALDEGGSAPPLALQLPQSVTRAVEFGKFRFAYRKGVAPTDAEAKKHNDTIKKRIQRFQDFILSRGLAAIGTVGEGDDETQWIWLTGKPVYGPGFIWPPKKKAPEADAPLVDPATGEDIDTRWF